MRKRIFICVLLACVVATLLLVGGLTYAAVDSAVNRTNAELRALAAALKATTMDDAALQSFASLEARTGLRVTWIDPDGRVRYDNLAQASTMDNHADRKEVAQALENGEGSDRRDSGTLNETYLYYALRLADGSILRLAKSEKNVMGMILDMRVMLLVIMLSLLALSVLGSELVAAAIVRPLNTLDLEHPGDNDTYTELTPLLGRIDQQNRKLLAQVEATDRQRRQLEEITRSMREGLIVLDEGHKVLSINDSAKRMLDIRKPCAGANILEIARNPALVDALRASLDGETAQTLFELRGRFVEVHLSPVRPGGSVLLLVDVTEQHEAETMRRAFSANVSHELKTPLTSISGYAELIAGGKTSPEDTVVFAGRIYTQSQRLIALIGDIIRLSKLDEGEIALPFENVDLYQLAGEVLDAHADAAKDMHVTISLDGDDAHARVVRQLAWEMLGNVVDNAIKYNRKGGSVAVRIENTPEGARLTVADTGIGIPPADQARVFERFYRVDKSHSKETGGTGLGLSIVKHAAAFMHVTLELKSVLGEGTRVEMLFPNA